jgi:endonuclease-3 related protein
MEPFSTRGLMEIYTRLLLHFGDPDWWPGDSPFEIAVGAILTQNTSWSNVEKAIINLKDLNLLGSKEITEMDIEQIASAIKPAGYFNQKAEYLKSLSIFISRDLNGEVRSLSKFSIEEAREKLLSIKGVGRETTDSILCYAVDLPVFVVDAYTKRIFKRLESQIISDQWGPRDPRCKNIQDMVMARTRGDSLFYNRIHALLVFLGKDHCRSKPKCVNCPLRNMCRIGKEYAVDNRQNEK